MRTRKRVTKFILAAIAVGALASTAPASAGCAYVTLYVERNGTPTYLANNQCVNTPWATDGSGQNDEVSVTPPGVAVGYGVTPATPP